MPQITHESNLTMEVSDDDNNINEFNNWAYQDAILFNKMNLKEFFRFIKCSPQHLFIQKK